MTSERVARWPVVVRGEHGDVLWQGQHDEDAARWWFREGHEADQIHTADFRAADDTSGIPVEEVARYLFPDQQYAFAPGTGAVVTPYGRADDEGQAS